MPDHKLAVSRSNRICVAVQQRVPSGNCMSMLWHRTNPVNTTYMHQLVPATAALLQAEEHKKREAEAEAAAAAAEAEKDESDSIDDATDAAASKDSDVVGEVKDEL